MDVSSSPPSCLTAGGEPTERIQGVGDRQHERKLKSEELSLGSGVGKERKEEEKKKGEKNEAEMC